MMESTTLREHEVLEGVERGSNSFSREGISFEPYPMESGSFEAALAAGDGLDHLQDPYIDAIILNELMKKASPKYTERFSAADIINSPLVTQAAAKELIMHANAGNPTTAYEMEIERQATLLDLISQDVKYEADACVETSSLLVQHLDQRAKSTEKFCKVLQKMAAAELAYTGTMASTSGRVMKDAVDDSVPAGIRPILKICAAAFRRHSAQHNVLSAHVGELDTLLKDFRQLSRELSRDTLSLSRAVDAGRKKARGSFNIHASSARALSEVLSLRHSGRCAAAPETDPWATEAQLVQDLWDLQHCVEQLRACIRSCRQSAEVLASRHDVLEQQCSTSLAQAYSTNTIASAADVLQDKPKPSHLPLPDEDEVLECHIGGHMENFCQDPFSSPEIVRQGCALVHDTSIPLSRDIECLVVLTRAGFLHWYRAAEANAKVGMLSLRKCQLDEGKAPKLVLVCRARQNSLGGVILGSSMRHVTITAPTVEECCEWTIAIREAIEIASARAKSFDDI